jgi:hypothetical protein
VTPAIARPRALLDELVAVHAIPPLLVVRQSDRVLHVHLAPVERIGRTSLDDEPFLVLGSGDLDVVRVGAVPVAHGVARVVDDVDLPLGGGVCDFEAVGRWGVVLGSWYIEGLGAAGLTVEIDVGLAFAFLPVCTPFELVWTRRAGGCGKSAAGEERGKNCGFGEHVDVLIGDYRD